MFFRNYRLRHIWLDKCLKFPFERTLQQATWYTVSNTFEISTRSPLSYLLITVKEIEMEKVSLSDM